MPSTPLSATAPIEVVSKGPLGSSDGMLLDTHLRSEGLMNSGEMLLAVAEGGHTADRVPVTSLEVAGLLERTHLQEWVVAHPEILGDGVMITTVEYDGFVVAGGAQKDRLDVLGLDPDGHLIVAELKRGIAPDPVEMQAVKYAAMASRFTLKTLASAYAAFKTRRGTAITVDEATEALQTHAPTLSDETLSEPRVVVVAQGFSPVVISSVVWLNKRGVDIALVRFQPYQTQDGRIFVTFSRLFPLPELPIVAPGTPMAEVPTNALPSVEWTTADLVALGQVANVTTRTTLDLCAERPDSNVSLTEIVESAGISRAAGRGQLAGLTMVVKNRFGRKNWPFAQRWAADGTPQSFYAMSATTAARWREAAIQLDAEQSDASVDGDIGGEQAAQVVAGDSE